MEDSEVVILERAKDYVKFTWRGNTYVERYCHDCKGSGWLTIIPDKKGQPCFTCRGRGTIPRRV